MVLSPSQETARVGNRTICLDLRPAVSLKKYFCERTCIVCVVVNGGGALLWFGGLEHFLFSHTLGIIIPIPIDYYFSEGFKPPTRYLPTSFNRNV